MTAADGVYGVSGTGGVDARSGAIGPYASGLVVVQDDINEGGAQNFKLVDWAKVRAALGEVGPPSVSRAAAATASVELQV